jgi:NUMOD1 domain
VNLILFLKKKHTIYNIEKIKESKSLGKIYIYNSLKELLVIFPSLTTFSRSINASYNYIKKVSLQGTLFRGEWYLTKSIISSSDLPKFDSYRKCESLIKEIKLNSTIKQAIFLFDLNGNFIKRFNGIIEAESSLKIRHEKIKKAAISNSNIGNYKFSYHRLIS